MKWDYCECGCKSYKASYYGRHYKIYWDLASCFYLSTGFEHIGTYGAYENAKQAAEDHLKQSKIT